MEQGASRAGNGRALAGPAWRFWGGLAFWAAVCALAIAVRGVRWEEGFERAQVLLGLTPYPDGHPHDIWYRNAFSIHYVASAALLWLTDSAAAVCGARQALANMAVHLPVFAITWLLSGRRAFPAHAATILSVAGAPAVFQSYWPVVAFANKATSGMIGIGWSLWVIAAIGAGWPRLAGLLFGLMPLVHIGQWPLVLATVCAWLAWSWWRGQRRAAIRFAWAALAGLLCCAVFASAYSPLRATPPKEGVYRGGEDGQAVWADYVTHEDMHRAPVDWPRFGPLGNSLVAMMGFLVLAAPLAWREARKPRKHAAAFPFFVFCLVSLLAVAGVQLLHRTLGEDVLYLAVVWMPYRFTAHAALLVLCGACAWCGRDRRYSQPLLLAAALAWVALALIWDGIAPAWAARYLALPEVALFLAAGGALPWLYRVAGADTRFRAGWTLTLGAGLLALAWYHQVAFAGIVAGALLAILASRVAPIVWRVPRAGMAGVGCVLAAAVLAGVFHREWRTREHLPVSDFESAAAAYFKAHADPGDGVLTPLDEHYQMVLEQPVIATFETRQHIGYMPEVAATVARIYADLYGVRDGNWYDWELWRRRSESEWRDLARAYGFRYVISKDFHPLQLPVRVAGDGIDLYEIPGFR